MTKSRKRKNNMSKVKVFEGYNDSIQVRLNKDKVIRIPNLVVKKGKFGEVFYINDMQQMRKISKLADKVKKECMKIRPAANYTRFNPINFDRIRIKISEYHDVDYIDFNGFTKDHEYTVDTVCLLKITKYKSELFFGFTLVLAKLIKKEEAKPFVKKVDYSKYLDNHDDGVISLSDSETIEDEDFTDASDSSSPEI